MFQNHFFKSPLGWMQIKTENDKIIFVDFVQKGRRTTPNKTANVCQKQLEEYFSGKRKIFVLPLFWQGTPFQQSVWQKLLAITYGKTWSYQEVADSIENPKAARAVGQAIHKNPLAVIVPCHRVIGSNGKLVGYAQGLGRKEWLLRHEGCFCKENSVK